MDLYTLTDTFLKDEVIDIFDSLIWTERYNASGDVTLVIPTTSPFKDILKEGVFLSTPASKEVMLIDTVSDQDGQCTITGSSLVAFLAQRILRDSWSAAKDSWSLTGSAGQISAEIVTQMCLAGGIMAGSAVISPNGSYELIPLLTVQPYPDGDSITVAVQYGNVYDGVKTVCDQDNLGFTMYPPLLDGSGNLYFVIYRGTDRTSSQDTNSVVVFEPALDSITNITELRSIAGYKTAAYVWPNGITAAGQVGTAFVPGTEEFVGFNRRTLMVDASDVNVADYEAATLSSILTQKGIDALANNNYVRLSDGEIVPQNAFQYGVDYNLGDVIELRNSTNTPQAARITEYIRSQDNTGEKAYPTLSVIS